MKIGILTFHYGYNYGGVLQAYALQEFIKHHGHDISIINYIPLSYKVDYLYGITKRHPLRSFKHLVSNLLHQKNSIISFENFRSKYLNTTIKSTTISELEQICIDFDIIIVGSDQVWNPSQHDKKIYFLDFNLSKKTKRISYAACCTVNEVKEVNRKTLEAALHKFDSISVRNKETQKFVQDLVHIESEIVLDPTFLWDFNEMLYKDENQDKYILTYIIGSDLDGNNSEAIRKIKSEYGNMQVIAIVIGAVAGVIHVPWADKVIYDASPIEFLNYIKNAYLLFTDSFHGVVFAFKFKTKFIGYYTEHLRSSRFIDLKRRYDLDRFIVRSINEITCISEEVYANKFAEIEVKNNLLLLESTKFLSSIYT